MGLPDGRMLGLDLFSGIGGISIALSPWVRPIAYCEVDRFAQSVLLSRMDDGTLPFAPIWDDITTLHGDMFDLPIDIVYGGFPCQNISMAGTGAGLDGERSRLFFEVVRLANELKPRFLFLENVPAIRTRGLQRVIKELSLAGYDCRWGMLSAGSLGASHQRQRWFCLAHTSGSRLERIHQTERDIDLQHPGERSVQHQVERFKDLEEWKTEPRIPRVAHGLQDGSDRIKCLGNAVVPKQVREAFIRLSGLHELTHD